MDATWAAIGGAAVGAIPGVLAYIGSRGERRVKRRSQVVEGYDKLVDDLQADNAQLREQVRQMRTELDQMRTELDRLRRRPRGGGR